jgi:hypothetical protein
MWEEPSPFRSTAPEVVYVVLVTAVPPNSFQFFSAQSWDVGATALDGGWRCRSEGGWRLLVLAGLLGREDGEELAEVLSRRSWLRLLSWHLHSSASLRHILL